MGLTSHTEGKGARLAREGWRKVVKKRGLSLCWASCRHLTGVLWPGYLATSVCALVITRGDEAFYARRA